LKSVTFMDGGLGPQAPARSRSREAVNLSPGGMVWFAGRIEWRSVSVVARPVDVVSGTLAVVGRR
jgi:hypothetical protein